MSKKDHVSETPATAWLKKNKIPFEQNTYPYVEHGGTSQAAKFFGVDEHMVVKTLIMEDEHGHPLVILMHGDCEVSTKNLARQANLKSIRPCTPEQAQRNSGYQVGGTSPFGTKKKMPLYAEATIFDLPKIYINGGRRGFNVLIDPEVLETHLGAVKVNCALPHENK
ncbi:MAG: aminoacyl-tRNA deacylase [Burkholderiales bacterium]|nr:aminoacyl-tRNA deacylase [Burkholderiales bacterium]